MNVKNIMRFESPAEMSTAALSSLASYSLATIRAKGSISIALSGGNSPLGLFTLIGKGNNRELLPWDKVHFFWVDERFVPYSHPESNFGVARDTFLSKINIPEENLHPIDTSLSSPAKAALDYRKELEAFFGSSRPIFDLVLLGLGKDGHTASLFPNSPAVFEHNYSVMAVPPPLSASPHLPRITMTFPVLDRAKKIYIITTGADKQHVIRYVLSEASQEIRYPVQRLVNDNVNWYISNL